MKTFTITSPEIQMNVEDLQPGIYLQKLETENAVVMKRLVIQFIFQNLSEEFY